MAFVFFTDLYMINIFSVTELQATAQRGNDEHLLVAQKKEHDDDEETHITVGEYTYGYSEDDLSIEVEEAKEKQDLYDDEKDEKVDKKGRIDKEKDLLRDDEEKDEKALYEKEDEAEKKEEKAWAEDKKDDKVTIFISLCYCINHRLLQVEHQLC